MYSFFKFKNSKDIEPHPEILMIPEFKKIWERDKTNNKVKAKNDFAIIYYGGYFNSPYNRYGDNKWNKIGERFKNDKNWRPEKDKDVKAALDAYQEMQNTPSLRILQSLRDSLETSDAVISQVSRNIRTIAQQQEEEDDNTKSLQNMEKLFKYIERLLKMQGSIPESINSLVEQEKKVFEELSQKKVRGGGTIGSREIPNRDG
jgi:hypothetical protein